MTIRKKLLALAVPAVLAVIAVPVAVAQAHALTPGRTGATATVHAGSSAVVAAAARTQMLTPARITKAPAAAAAKATDPAEAPDGATDPAETGTDTGHADETPGSTGESTTDHQFDGQE